MKRIINSNHVAVYFTFILVLLYSYNNAGNESSSQNTKVDNTTKKSQIPATSQSPLIAINGNLDKLYVLSTDFNKLAKNRNLVLSFYIDQGDKITLHGWQCNNNLSGHCTKDFNTNPDIQFLNGAATTTTYGPGTYFGDIILDKDQIKEIQKNYSNQYTHVIFIPRKNGAMIYYDIYVDNSPPTILAEPKALVDTQLDTNPSPPKNYN